jgi:hypothetical protein
VQPVVAGGGDGHVRSLQVLLVDDVVDALALMRTYMFGVRVCELLVVLDGEVLPLNMLFELFSLNMSRCRLGKAVLDLGGAVSIAWWVGSGTSPRIIAIFEFVMQLEFVSGVIDLLGLLRRHERPLGWVVDVAVESLAPVDNLMHMRALLRAVSKANGLGPIGVLWVASTRILINLGWLLALVNLLCQLRLVGGIDFIWSILTLLADRVGGRLHQPVDALVDLKVRGVNRESLAVVDSGHGGVVSGVGAALRSGQMGLRALIITELEVSVLAKTNGA